MRLFPLLSWAVALALGAAATTAHAANDEAASASLVELRTRIEAHLAQPHFADALWAIKIVSRDSGQALFTHHPTRPMSPASNSKLYTAALALDRFGGDYRIVTPIGGTARPDEMGILRGDVIVSGRGDPSWSARNAKTKFWETFSPLVEVLRKAGVRRVTGDIVADATWFRSLPNGAGWTADDLNDYYGAEISAVTLEDNYAELRVGPGLKAGAPCETTWAQPFTGLTVENRTTTSDVRRTPHLVSRRVFGERVVYLFGELPLGGKETVVDVTVPRPAAWFAAAFKEALVRAGIPVDGAARGVRWPETLPMRGQNVGLGEVVSPPLRDLIAALMKPSQNLETDLIFAHVGESTRTAAAPAWRTSEELGVAALREFLRQHALPVDEVRFEEGSGLSRNNLTTANATVALLQFMARHRESDAFVASLPVAGVDGTLRRRMNASAAEGNVRAKTGSLRYANSLSGYVTTAGGERLIFSLMLNRNGTQPAGRTVRQELDDIAVMLARFSGRSTVADSR